MRGSEPTTRRLEGVLDSSGECAGVRRAGEGVGEGIDSEVGKSRDGSFEAECELSDRSERSGTAEPDAATRAPWYKTSSASTNSSRVGGVSPELLAL